jgi:hypothetical protein
VLTIEIGAGLIALALLRLPWGRLPASLLLIYPGILAAVLIAAASLERPFTASYIGTVTVAFIYIGITQSRLMPLLAMPIAIVVYLRCEVHVTPGIDVRLPMAEDSGDSVHLFRSFRTPPARRGIGGRIAADVRFWVIP